MTLFIPRKEFNIKSGLGIFQSVGKRELSGHYTSQGLRQCGAWFRWHRSRPVKEDMMRGAEDF